MLKFTAGVSKGNIEAGYTFNDPFKLGKVDPNYTSSRVVTNYTIGSTPDNQKVFKMDWKPVIEGTVSITVNKKAGGTDQYVVVDVAGAPTLVKVPEGGKVTRRTVMVQPVADASSMGDLRLEGAESKVETVVYTAEGTADTTSAGTVDYSAGTITFTAAFAEGDTVEVAYTY